jgi:hypothetical protein
MTNAHTLIDLAKERCEGRSYAALARRLGVTPQTVHLWKNSDSALPTERIVEIAEIARENAENWTILILRDQAKGIERKTWESVVKRLGIAASVVLLLGALSMPAPALASNHFPDERSGQAMHYAKWRRLFAQLLRKIATLGRPLLQELPHDGLAHA